ncbi:MAG: Sec-independent protein translocase protein TatB [Sphingomonadales bacterium]|uniref:Sec-independent protein translocase protein TatB n=1 Tax=Novosphingobium sp. NDB2Meth1 TaxID=1892847 RepID=UPI0009312B95|nr:Sec-independent protein translocase protein TatB [Novosphingobium sp. NDB2Meth1]MBU6393671.1 Sec-independent protein translocase protein TatB [Sphingomonadales bacterium]
MFGIAPDEMLLVVIVAIIVIGPKDLPLALRTAGRWIGKIRRVSGHFRAGIETMIREAEMEEMERKWKEQNAAIMAAHPTPDPAAGQTVEAATDQNDPPPLMTPLPAPIDPEVAAVAPTEPVGEMLPISQRPERARGPAEGAA